jgi:sulfide:quinone oxidoreductase
MKVLAPKAGIFAHYQAEVVARNIALLIKGKKPRLRYTAKGL